MSLLEELVKLFHNQGFSDSGMNNLYLLDHELGEVANKEIQEHGLEEWFSMEEHDLSFSGFHEYIYDTEHDGIQLSFDCSIILDEYEENQISYLNIQYHSVLLTHPDGTERVLNFD